MWKLPTILSSIDLENLRKMGNQAYFSDTTFAAEEVVSEENLEANILAGLICNNAMTAVLSMTRGIACDNQIQALCAHSRLKQLFPDLKQISLGSGIHVCLVSQGVVGGSQNLGIHFFNLLNHVRV